MRKQILRLSKEIDIRYSRDLLLQSHVSKVKSLHDILPFDHKICFATKKWEENEITNNQKNASFNLKQTANKFCFWCMGFWISSCMARNSWDSCGFLFLYFLKFSLRFSYHSHFIWIAVFLYKKNNFQNFYNCFLRWAPWETTDWKWKF